MGYFRSALNKHLKRFIFFDLYKNRPFVIIKPNDNNLFYFVHTFFDLLFFVTKIDTGDFIPIKVWFFTNSSRPPNLFLKFNN